MGFDPVGVGQGELGECLLPVRGDLTLDEAGCCFAFVGGFATLPLAVAGSFVLDVADRQPEQLDHGVVAGEETAVLDDLEEMTRRSSGGKARNGVNRSQAFSNVATVLGYRCPRSLALNASSSTLAVSASAAW